MEPATNSQRNHEERLQLWFVPVGAELAEVEWCGDDECPLCAAVEPWVLDPAVFEPVFFEPAA